MGETKVCGKCGSKNPVANGFCEQCGAKLQGQGPTERPSKPSLSPTAKPARSSIEDPKERPSSPSLSSGRSFSWLELAYFALLLITLFTRFDHLGNKPHHHDESMHAFYSYQLFHDGDYKYDPMMHGPFQFHGNALMYFFFGVSDATSRYLAAFFGVLTVVMAMFMSPFLGRIGAFLATLLIVFSPSFMYFDRFTREDAYIAGATFMMVVFLFRYMKSRLPLDLWLATVGFSIAFCTKESIFLTVAVLGTYLFIRLLPWLDVFMAGGITIFALLTQLIIPKGTPFRTNVFLLLAGAALLYTLFQLFMRWQTNLRSSKQESDLWRIVCSFGLEKIKWELLATLAWWVLAVLLLKITPSIGQNGGVAFLMLAAYFAILFRFFWLWLTNVVPAVTGSISLFGVIFTLLFTTFFTVGSNAADAAGRLHGLFYSLYNGAFGGLEYWWKEHDTRRGDQPWYYYIVQLPANEMVSFLFSMVAIVYYGIFNRKNLPLFLAYWYVGSLALFSWAGEKMPWLILHPLLPALLLTAYFMGEILESKPLDNFRRFAKTAAIWIFGFLFAYSLHSAVLLSFYHEDNPVEPLVYVQSGPDTKVVERIVREVSYGETGGTDLAITIEDKCSWPFAWSLKDFPKRNHPSTITSADNGIIMTGTESDAQAYPILSQAGYVARKYKLRVWWVPSWFKKGFPSSPLTAGLFGEWVFANFIPMGKIPVIGKIFPQPRPDMVDWNDLRKWLLYREVWSDLGSYNMRLWLRPDLAQKYGFTGAERTDINTPGWPPEPTSTEEKGKDRKHRD